LIRRFRVAASIRDRSRGEIILDEFLSLVAPLGWEHIAFNGDTFGPSNHLALPSGLYGTRAPSFSTRRSVLFREDSARHQGEGGQIRRRSSPPQSA
jgi:hypothetical protein